MLKLNFENKFTTSILEIEPFLRSIFQYCRSNEFDYCYFNNNSIPYLYDGFENCILISFQSKNEIIPGEHVFKQLEKLENSNSLLSGFLSYDIKNELENLSSENESYINSPLAYFFKPDLCISITDNQNVEIYSNSNPYLFLSEVEKIKNTPIQSKFSKIVQTVDRNEYLKAVNAIKNHIIEGDIYELNYCIEFQSKAEEFNSFEVYKVLNEYSPMPFSCLCSFGEHEIISASPERFLKKEGQTLVSQPIKGTSRRGVNEFEDQILKHNLETSEKEIAENMMIVDLVRNDLNKNSEVGSTKVEEAFKVYSFKKVHQMISTITSTAKPDVKVSKLISDAFPMGSMTGAPKIKAMELIDKFEIFKRGIYSGAIGYIDSEKKFDFNVVIRTLMFNKNTKNISFAVGSAITYDSDPVSEYEECLVKADSMIKTLQSLN